MEKKWRDIILSVLVFIAIISIGSAYIVHNSTLGYTDSAILLLAAVVGAGCFWIGINNGK